MSLPSMLKQILRVGLLLSLHLLYGQTDYIAGQLIDAETLDPIPFASVRIKNKAIGLISNIDGGFRIPISFKSVGDTLEISSLGYKTKEAFLSKFSINQINTIFLYENIENLKEVVVTATQKPKRLNAKEIVALAIKKIDQNYPSKAFSYLGYYRDYQLREHNYLNLNEAVLAIFDPGFGLQDLKNTQIRIYEYLENPDFPRDSMAAQTYDYANRKKVIPKATISGRIGNEFVRLRLHDAIRNNKIYTYSFIDRLETDLIKNHKLKLTADAYFDEIALYTIKITKSLDNIKVIGKIYINQTTLGIHKLEYAVYEKEPPKHRKDPFWNVGIETMDDGILGKLLYNIKVEYRSHKDKLYLNYISFNNAFDILLPPKFAPIAAKIDSDRKRFELVLNNQPSVKEGLKTKNYQLYYQENKVTIENVEIKKNSVFLYPKRPEVVFNPEIIQYLKTKTNKGVAIEIKDVRDIDGNMVNESDAIHYQQFREFFTQQLLLDQKPPSDDLYMLKTIPINKNQPLGPSSDSSDYWMNTPLKK